MWNAIRQRRWLLLLAVAVGPNGVAALEAGSWKPLGPFGGPMRAAAYAPGDPQTLLAAGPNGLAKSTDGGLGWTWMHPGLPQHLDFLQFSPSNAETVYLGGANGVYRSEDGGLSWLRLGKLTNAGGLVFHPQSPDTLYAMTYGGLYKSTRRGDRWGLLKSPEDIWGKAGAFRQEVRAAALDPVNPEIVHLGGRINEYHKTRHGYRSFTSSAYLATSPDAGKHWDVQSGAGLQAPDGTPLMISALVIDPNDPAHFYAGTTTYDVTSSVPAPGSRLVSGYGVYQTTDGGAHWQESNAGLAVGDPASPNAYGDVRALIRDPANAQTLYAVAAQQGKRSNPSLFKTEDGGAHWQGLTEGLADAGGNLPEAYGLQLHPATPSKLLLTTDHGLYLSSDGGSHWQAIGAELSGIPVFGLTSDPGNPAHLLIATGDGGSRSDDGGTTWQPLGGLDPITAQANRASFLQTSSSIVRAPSDPNVVYLERQSGLFEHHGLSRSRDGGITWQAARQELQGSDYLLNGIRTLTVDPANPDQIYAGIDLQSKPSDQPPYDVISGGIYRSSDGGDSWQHWGNGLRDFNGMEPQVQSIVIDPKNTSTFYAGTQQTVFKSTDGGSHWKTARRGLGTLGANILAIDPSNTRRLFAGTRRGIYHSQDGGASWQPLNPGQDLENPLDNWLLKRSADGFFALKETV
jgi:photosystem II stability/assembly factor-like uncharacterized protein